jgi:hypothetical protein
MSNHDSVRLVAYCGLYCGLCAQRSRIPQQPRQLQEALHEEGYNDWYKYVPEMKDAFPPFWQFLQNLITSDCTCRISEGGPGGTSTQTGLSERNILELFKAFSCAIAWILQLSRGLFHATRFCIQVFLERWMLLQLLPSQ